VRKKIKLYMKLWIDNNLIKNIPVLFFTQKFGFQSFDKKHHGLVDRGADTMPKKKSKI